MAETLRIFKPKGKPILRWGRVWHFAITFFITTGGGHFWGDQGSIWAVVGCIFGGLLWEFSNTGKAERWLAGILSAVLSFISRGRWSFPYTPGWHPYADSVDFYAFVAGAVCSGLGFNILEVL